jgi:hypothetical protein
LVRAETLADHGFFDEAIILATAAVDQVDAGDPPAGGSEMRLRAHAAIEWARTVREQRLEGRAAEPDDVA